MPSAARPLRAIVPNGSMSAAGLLTCMTLFQVLWVAVRSLLVDAHEWRLLPLSIAITVGIVFLIIIAPITDSSRRLLAWFITRERLLLFSLAVTAMIVNAVFGAIYMFPSPPTLEGFSAVQLVSEEGVASFFSQYATLSWLGTKHPPLVPLAYGMLRVLPKQMSPPSGSHL